MSNKRKKHKTDLKFKEAPKARKEISIDLETGLPQGYRKVDHVINNTSLHADGTR